MISVVGGKSNKGMIIEVDPMAQARGNPIVSNSKKMRPIRSVMSSILILYDTYVW